jgi:pyruvate/2-oxoglutarate dehydrogenase complex dihydrolipoamide acyltransferase (E2) component
MTAGEAPPGVTKLGMPKWGLSMREGKVTDWPVDEGEEVAEGEELFEVETEKIDGAVESPAAGVLRRRVAQVGAVVPVGGLVVWGGQDRILPAAHAEALAGRARVEVLVGAGHSPHMEAANEVNRLVCGFLDELEGAGQRLMPPGLAAGGVGSSPWCPPRRRRPRPPSRSCW